MNKFWKFFIPFLYLMVSVGGVLSFEFYFKDKIDTVEVIVASTDINFKDVIQEDDISILKIRKDYAILGGYKPQDINLIVGYNASINIKKGTQLYPDLIDTFDLIPNELEGEFIAPIPASWIFTVAGSLRRSYIADFYAIPQKEQGNIASLLQDRQDIIDVPNPNEVDENIEQEEIPSKDDDEIITGREPILENVKVASVRDGSNREVVESKENNQASGSITSLEIIADEEMLNILKDYTQKGYKLYIVYKFGK